MTQISTITAAMHRDQELVRVRWKAAGQYAARLDPYERLPHTKIARRDWIEDGRHFTRWERTWSVPLEEGLVILRRDVDDRWGLKHRYAVVRDGSLVELTKEDAEDFLDPTGAADRAAWRLQEWEEIEYRVIRSRGGGMTVGVYESRPGVYRYCTKAWPRQYECRNARPEEIAAYLAERTVS